MWASPPPAPPHGVPAISYGYSTYVLYSCITWVRVFIEKPPLGIPTRVQGYSVRTSRLNRRDTYREWRRHCPHSLDAPWRHQQPVRSRARSRQENGGLVAPWRRLLRVAGLRRAWMMGRWTG